ncbi:ABC transporter substrate-binding protein [Neorhizobium petrolearium]|uniref:ABC transporter substrate-binding protein n=1 Tax=Neorhizobium petrolearium TaxID=515361 RepID=A0ABY8MAR6_9HYPH|nr:ABC transporter substrate-binding protein [Neorhizobium petrolearium]MCC2614120.1 ABC transporter substrate-binding protein [Neorhizobium petrolearium]WGI71635.1 ABC transporter substrate-binding protein [Neorhizobium petrolearium]
MSKQQDARSSIINGSGINRRTLLASSAVLGGAMLLPGRTFAQASQPSPGGTLRIAMPFNPAALDPITGRNVPDFNALYAIFDALIAFDPATLELKPMLAKDWTFTDPKTLVLNLVDGVKFHDGTPFTAEAVKFNLDRSMNDPRSNVKSDLVSVASVAATGSGQVTIKLKQPNYSLPTILTGRVGCIVSPASIQAAANGNVDRNPVGTGPFKFVEWQDNTLIKVARNPDYWQKGLPYLDGIDFRIINELNTAARTVTAGETDLALNMAAQQIATARRMPDLTAEANPSMIFFTLMMNFAKPPLNDIRVRQAMNYAINREELNKVLMLGLGQPTSTMFPKDFWAVDAGTANFYQHDPEKARKLLAEAGYPNGLEVETWSWPDQTSIQRLELVGNQLSQVGIRLKVTPSPPQVVNQFFYIEGKGSMILNPQGGWLDPSQTYERLFGASGQFNAGKVEDPQFRKLLDATGASADAGERKAAFAALQRFVVEQALHLPLVTSAAMSIRNKKVKDWHYDRLHSPRFHRVWLDQNA